MKPVSIIAVLLLLAVNALPLLPVTPPDVFAPYLSQPWLSGGTLVLGMITLFAILLIRSRASENPLPVAAAARPAPAPLAGAGGQVGAEAEILGLLGVFQEKGRLVDFLMEDINGADDAQVGAAARVVHNGCRAALDEHFRIRPVRTENEGTTIVVPTGYAADEYRLVGKISGQAPFSGVLVHHGWKTEQVRLPRILRGADGKFPAIAPAEVELK
jgi:hypothetical protein